MSVMTDWMQCCHSVGVLLRQHHAMLLTMFDTVFLCWQVLNIHGKDCHRTQPKFARDKRLIGTAHEMLCARELTTLLPSGVSSSDANVMIYC